MLARFINGRNRSNAYVYAPRDANAILVDAGVGAARKMIDLVEADGLLPRALVLTHGHPDHIWTARELADRFRIPTYIHSGDLPWFTDPATGTHLPLVRGVGRAIARWKRLLPRDLRRIGDNETIELGPMSVEVIHTPGHSKGSVCLQVNDLCFAGDTVFAGNVGHGAFPGGDPSALRRSVGRLLELSDEVHLLPGHGERTTVAAERPGWIDFAGRGLKVPERT